MPSAVSLLFVVFDICCSSSNTWTIDGRRCDFYTKIFFVLIFDEEEFVAAGGEGGSKDGKVLFFFFNKKHSMGKS